MRETLFPTNPPPSLPPEIAKELELSGETYDVELVVRGRGGMFEGRAVDVSPVGLLVALPLPKLDRRFDDCFRTGADVRFPGLGFAVRADLVYSVRGVVDRKERVLGAFQFRRELSVQQCVQLRATLQACVA